MGLLHASKALTNVFLKLGLSIYEIITCSFPVSSITTLLPLASLVSIVRMGAPGLGTLGQPHVHWCCNNN